MSGLPPQGLALPEDPDVNHAHVVQVAVGEEHALLLTDQGFVYSWAGKHDLGQLGRKPQKDNGHKPMPIKDTLGDHIIVQIACGRHHSLALTQTGRLYAWGYNKAGQLGVKHMSEVFKPKAKLESNDPSLRAERPEVVEPFTGDDPNFIVKSISCGPESSACITTKGEVYIWGAVSYYLLGRGRNYARAEDNCTRPARLKSWKDDSNQEFCLQRIAVYKDTIAGTFGHVNQFADLDSILTALKERVTRILKELRLWQTEDLKKSESSSNDLELEELRNLREEWTKRKRELSERKYAIEELIQRLEEEFRRISRELTVCDQQDIALTDATVKIEVRKGEGTVNHSTAVVARNLETQLHDLDHFKDANRKTKMRLLDQRDKNEQQRWQLDQELKDKASEMKSLDMRMVVLQNLQRQRGGKERLASSTIDDGLNIAYSKHHELKATDPEELAGVGNFTGLREVMMISERAQQDVSSALKEVSQALSGPEGSFLESILEVNLKLRKERNAAIHDKLHRVEGRVEGMNKPPSDIDSDRLAEGIPEYFNEARRGGSVAEAVVV